MPHRLSISASRVYLAIPVYVCSLSLSVQQKLQQGYTFLKSYIYCLITCLGLKLIYSGDMLTKVTFHHSMHQGLSFRGGVRDMSPQLFDKGDTMSFVSPNIL